jgi:glycosyltransferase involved in cell wall biosynthesis
MRVLYISNFKNLSGWSTQAVNHILALDSAGVEVVPRHFNLLNNLNQDLPERVKELEKADDSHPDVIIFNTLPTYYEKTGRSKCVGYYVVETSNFRASGWASHMKLMDALACPCYHNKQAAVDSGVKEKIHIVPECVDTSRYTRTYPTHQIRKNNPDKFIFLCVAEWTKRKNIEAVIRAFHTEFSPTEPVELVIKTTPTGMQRPESDINGRLESIKRGLKLYNNVDRYKRENVICGFLSETDMASLMQSSDCLVNASRGEAFCIPVVDAMGFGKVVISPDHTGLDYVNEKNAYVVDSIEQPCFEANDTLPELYTSDEYWHEVRLQALRAHMRSAFEKRTLNLKKIQQARKDVQEFSIENIGKVYKHTLEKIL